MTMAEWVTLAVAVLGVLHGPAFVPLWRMLRGKKGAK
jgi:hypothetical protein